MDSVVLLGFIQTYQTIIAASITTLIVVIGWIINHQLTLRAQKKNFSNQLYNSARIDISNSLREYQSFLIKLVKYYTWIDLKVRNNEISNDGWEVKAKNFTDILEDYNDKWESVMDGYVTLLPELDNVHKILKIRSDEIGKFILEVLGGNNATFTYDLFVKLAIEALKNVPVILEQISLIDDLILCLQVKTFANITDNPMPAQKDDKEDRPRFIIQNRKLEYVERKEAQ